MPYSKQYTYMQKIIATFVVILSFIVSSACSNNDPPQNTAAEGRWYTSPQVIAGQKIFADNCASCHGNEAQSLVTDWKKPQADGKYPPPPLDGSAHAWHHTLGQLLRSINKGGIALGGSMPGFEDKLNDDEKLAVVAYFQNFWSDKVYGIWKERNGS